MPDYPFRFYQGALESWRPSPKRGQLIEVRFTKPKGTMARAGLIGSMVRFSKGIAIEITEEQWLWSGPWMLLFVRPRGKKTARAQAAGLEKMLRALHEEYPIKQVVAWGAIGPDPAWADWSLAQGAPLAGPPPKAKKPIALPNRRATLAPAQTEPDLEYLWPSIRDR